MTPTIAGAVFGNVRQRFSSNVSRLEKWASYANLAEAFLVLVNGLLVVSSCLRGVHRIVLITHR